MFFEFAGTKFTTLVADPPWRFTAFSDKGYEKSAQKHYDCMSIGDICAMPVASIAAKDCVLFLWTSAPMLDVGLDVLKAWGFKYKSRISWLKMTASGKVRMGPGYLSRTMHEDVLIATRGKSVVTKAFPSIFQGLAREHSRKPDEFYDMVVERCPGPYIDIFGRQSRDGWSVWGNEAEKFDIVREVELIDG